MATMGGYAKAAGEWPEKLGRAMIKATVQAIVQKSELGRKALDGGLHGHDAIDVTQSVAATVARLLAMKVKRLEVLTGGAGMQMPPAPSPLERMLVLGFDAAGALIDIQDLWGRAAQRTSVQAPTPQPGDKFLAVRVR